MDRASAFWLLVFVWEFFVLRCIGFVSPPTSILASIDKSFETSNKIQSSKPKPAFRNEFYSYWYLWDVSSKLGTQGYTYGSMEWIKNGTNMSYHFISPEKKEWYQLVIGPTMYIYNNNTCREFNFDFEFASDFFANASFCGLTDEPYEGVRRRLGMAQCLIFTLVATTT